MCQNLLMTGHKNLPDFYGKSGAARSDHFLTGATKYELTATALKYTVSGKSGPLSKLLNSTKNCQNCLKFYMQTLKHIDKNYVLLYKITGQDKIKNT